MHIVGTASCLHLSSATNFDALLFSRIDDIEDEIVREKQKIQKVGTELDETFEDMFYKY